MEGIPTIAPIMAAQTIARTTLSKNGLSSLKAIKAATYAPTP